MSQSIYTCKQVVLLEPQGRDAATCDHHNTSGKQGGVFQYHLATCRLRLAVCKRSKMHQIFLKFILVPVPKKEVC